MRAWTTGALAACVLAGCGSGIRPIEIGVLDDLGVADAGVPDLAVAPFDLAVAAADLAVVDEAVADLTPAPDLTQAVPQHFVEDFCPAGLSGTYVRCYVHQRPADGY